jgi:hypothetical protein
MNDGGKGAAAGGLLKNLQGLFRPGLTSKPAKAVRLPTTQELHQALASPEPGQLMRLMEVRIRGLVDFMRLYMCVSRTPIIITPLN